MVTSLLCICFQGNLIIIRPTAQAVVALTFANYILQPFFPYCESPLQAKKLFAALCISKGCLCHCVGYAYTMYKAHCLYHSDNLLV
jgi:hypothetical protein